MSESLNPLTKNTYMDWWHKAKYGLFIHWGVYSVAKRGEWIVNRERIPFDEYREKYATHFKAENYDPNEWAKLALEAGMKYMVLTTRHHDGYCLWNTRTTPFNSVQIGPGRDLVRQFVDACRKHDIRIGFYFSGADWYHPDYPDAYARDWPTKWRDEESRKRFQSFYMSQLEELLTEYGKIDILWYDGCIPEPFGGEAANKRARELQPDIIINERNGKPYDFRVAEQTLNAREGAWEANLTLNDSWGYFEHDHNWKSPKQVIRMLITTLRTGGNLLLNVGPQADGTIPEESVHILKQAGAWLKRNSEILASSERCKLSWPSPGVMLTTSANVVYAHLFASPGQDWCLAELRNKVLSVRLVDGGAPLPFEQVGPRLFIRGLPDKLDPLCTTIRIEVDGMVEPYRKQETFWIPD